MGKMPRIETDVPIGRPPEGYEEPDTSKVKDPEEILQEHEAKKKAKRIKATEKDLTKTRIAVPAKKTGPGKPNEIYIPDLDTIKAALPPDVYADLKTECTEKQMNFALLITHGVPPWKAYETAYDVGEKTKQSTKEGGGYRIAQSNTVKWAVALINRASATASLLEKRGKTLDPPDVVREWILAKLAQEAADKKNNSGAVRVRALESMAKAYRIFGERSPDEYETNEKDDSQDRAQALLKRARALKEQHQGEIIDAEIIEEGSEE